MKTLQNSKWCALLSTFMTALAGFNSACASKWDVEYWQYLNWENWQCCPFTLYTTGVIRINKDISKFYYYRISENFVYRALSWLDLEVHYSYIYSKPIGAPRFDYTNRLELEANPTVCFDSGAILKWRNRLEIAKKQHISQIAYIYRGRIMAVFPYRNCSRFLSHRVFDEVFYDFNIKKIVENRFAPIDLSFSLSQQVTLNIAFMIRNLRRVDRWHNSFVIASELEF